MTMPEQQGKLQAPGNGCTFRSIGVRRSKRFSPCHVWIVISQGSVMGEAVNPKVGAKWGRLLVAACTCKRCMHCVWPL